MNLDLSLDKEGTGGHYFDEIVNVIERLRGPGGCPWDREQTMESLRTCITEEAYELAEAITEGDMGKVREESGDLLLQIVFVASLARERGAFGMPDVVRTICDKLIRRHPHVFPPKGTQETGSAEDGDGQDDLAPTAARKDASRVSSAGEVLRNWERIKMEERRERKEDLSVLAGVPSGLPPLLKAHRLQGKAAHVGFDWPADDMGPLYAKLDEEIGELKEAAAQKDASRVEDELGDVLFMTVNLARRLKADPDAALSRACAKFRERFRLMEEMASAEDGGLSDRSLEELDVLWNRAKALLAAGGGRSG